MHIIKKTVLENIDKNISNIAYVPGTEIPQGLSDIRSTNLPLPGKYCILFW